MDKIETFSNIVYDKKKSLFYEMKITEGFNTLISMYVLLQVSVSF